MEGFSTTYAILETFEKNNRRAYFYVLFCMQMARWGRVSPWPVAQDAILKAAGSGIYEMRWNDAELTMGGKASANWDRWIIGPTAGICALFFRCAFSY